ncbi:MAG: sialidase family protein [Opitutales bacterium]|nr:sialidase family protein [Opitutales bacterium]
MIPWKSVLPTFFFIPLCSHAIEPTPPIPTSPLFIKEEALVRYQGEETNHYVAFPAIVPVNDDEVLISYKRGNAHARDTGAVLEIIRFHLKSGKKTQEPIELGIPKTIMQMGEWIRFPDGSLRTYIDAQIVKDGKHTRVGLQQALTKDNGKTFETLKPVGTIDGVEYGYLFDSATVGQRVYALIMTFEYLEGGRRTVDALYTDDNGGTWHFVKNLSEEFGDIRINESSLLPYKDGFLVTTRGYDNQQRLHHVDREFNLIQERNLTTNTPTMDSYLGRPRLFSYGGEYFLIGRNWRTMTREISMELGLFRIDPSNLSVDKHFVLDNIERADVTDGYYPCPILFETKDRKLLNVFDYRALFGNSPDIIRFQFDSADFLSE